MQVNSSTIAYAVAAVSVVLMLLNMRRKRSDEDKRLPLPLLFDRFLRNQAVTYITLGLIANTILAQLFIRSDGVILPPGSWAIPYIIVAAIGTTISFSLFEIVQVRLLNELMNDGLSHGLGEWTKNILASAFASAYNCYAIAMLEYAIDPAHRAATTVIVKGVKHIIPPQVGIPQIGQISATGWITAAGFTILLFLVSLVGERKRTAEQEVAEAQRDIQREILRDAKDEAVAVVRGKRKPGKAMLAMAVLGANNAKVFFANMINVYGDKLSIDDVVRAAGVKGVYAPGGASVADRETGKAAEDDADLAEEDDAAENAQKGIHQNGSGTGQYTADSPDFKGYVLPDGVHLTTYDAMSKIAKGLGIRPAALSDAWKLSNMTADPASDGQPGNAKNIFVWQALALVEMGLLDMPSNVQRRELSPVK